MTDLEIQNLRKLGPDSLRNFVTTSAKHERHHMLRVLYGLQEIERKRLFLEWGFSSLHHFCAEALGYSEGSAARRVQASRLLREVPEIKSKLEDGTISLSVAAQAQSFFYRESKTTEYSPQRKREVLLALDHKTTRETERELLKLSPQSLPQERLRQVTAEHQELRVLLDKNLLQAMEEFKSLSSHQLPNGSHQELIRKAFEIANATLLKKKIGSSRKKVTPSKPAQPANRALIHNPAPALERNIDISKTADPMASRFIPNATMRAVWERDQGCCAYVNPVTRRRCRSKLRLEFDHFPIPYARGGTSTMDNLRVACRQHNAYAAEKLFGRYNSRRQQASLPPH
jgi:hypothetical protein